MTRYKLISIQLSLKIVLATDNCPNSPEEAKKMKAIFYHRVLGSLIWLQVATCPDFLFSVNLLLQFAHNSREAH